MEMTTAELASLRDLIALGFREDTDQRGDITSTALLAPELAGSAWLIARQTGCIAGLQAAHCCFQSSTPDLVWTAMAGDGDRVEPGCRLAVARGSLLGILIAERLALNFIQRLSGIATRTSRFVDRIKNTSAAIFDTRKTTPGWRQIEKYAVRAGGGRNHRTGLSDGVLIKDNHLAAWKRAHPKLGIAEAIARCRDRNPNSTIEVEIDSLEQMREAIAGAPDIILLDNMDTDQIARAVGIRNELAAGIQLEASGAITLETVRSYAETGVDRISVGSITHSISSLDIALDFE